MTKFTLKKILNCLIRDAKNHDDLKDMFQEAIGKEIMWSKISIDGPDWYYEFEDDFGVLYSYDSKELAEILIKP